MEQVIVGGAYDAYGASDVVYNPLIGDNSWSPLEIQRIKVIGTSGKIKNLRVKLNSAPGAGKTFTFTLIVNGIASALTLDIAGATATSGYDTTHEVDVSGGDIVSLECDPHGVTFSRYTTWTSMFEGTTAKESLILGGSGSIMISSSNTTYAQIMGGETAPSTTENDQRQVCPTSGKIKNLYVKLNEAPGSGNSFTFTLRVDGVNSDLTVTISDDATTGNDTVHEISVSAEDILTMEIVPFSSPTFGTYGNWGMAFVADIDGESVILAGTDNDLNAGSTEYMYLQGDDNKAWHATEGQRYQLGQSCILKKLYVLLSAAPGTDKSYTFTLRKPGNGQADGNLTVTIAGAVATTGNDVAHTDVIADDDYLDLECTPTNTPDVVDAYWSLVGYIEPPAPPPAGATWNIASRVAMMGA